MGKILTEIAKTDTNPQIDIQFSVKDKDAVSEDLLINATENAKSKAEILARASNVILGDLMNIDYDWAEISFYSPTRYRMEDKVVSEPYAPDIEPDDISVSDTVSFIWEIK